MVAAIDKINSYWYFCSLAAHSSVYAWTGIRNILIMKSKKKRPENSPYNPDFVAKIKESQKQVAEGKFIVLNPKKSLWENLSNWKFCTKATIIPTFAV